MLIDSHCHLDHFLNEDLQALINRAKDAGVSLLHTISTDIEKFETIYDLTNLDPIVYCSVGVHPLEVKPNKEYPAAEIVALTERPKVIAIGETGLDYHYSKDTAQLQKRSFEAHIHASQESGLPIVIHSREAEDDTMSMLLENKKHKDYNGVLHCFTSSREMAFNAIDHDFYISASGIITFNKSQDLRDIFKDIPLNRILIETDAPFLAPVPFRGKKNEPSFVKYVAQTLAEIRVESYEDIVQATNQNFYRLFSKV